MLDIEINVFRIHSRDYHFGFEYLSHSGPQFRAKYSKMADMTHTFLQQINHNQSLNELKSHLETNLNPRCFQATKELNSPSPAINPKPLIKSRKPLNMNNW